MTKVYKKNRKSLDFTFIGQVRSMGDMYIIYVSKKNKDALRDYLRQDLEITVKTIDFASRQQ